MVFPNKFAIYSLAAQAGLVRKNSVFDVKILLKACQLLYNDAIPEKLLLQRFWNDTARFVSVFFACAKSVKKKRLANPKIYADALFLILPLTYADPISRSERCNAQLLWI